MADSYMTRVLNLTDFSDSLLRESFETTSSLCDSEIITPSRNDFGVPVEEFMSVQAQFNWLAQLPSFDRIIFSSKSELPITMIESIHALSEIYQIPHLTIG